MPSDVDIAPYIEKFEDFYSAALAEKIDRLLSEYPSTKSLLVDYEELERYDRNLADLLVKQPDLLLPAAETALIRSQEMSFKTAHPGSEFEPHVRFFNLPDSGLLIQDISARNIRELISVKGVVTKRGPILHKVRVAVYKCQMCDAKMKVPMTKNTQAPQVCSECKRRSLKLEEEDSYFVDVQYSEAQELLERLKGGAPAATIDLWFEDDQVNRISPGETIIITGVMRLRPPRKGKGARESESAQIYSRYIDVLYAKKTKRDFEEIETTKDDERQILELSKLPDIYDRMRESIAPGIYGHEEVKEALSLQLFGGTKDKFMPGGAPIRDDIHVLLIGDPGSAKTRFLQYVRDMAPKGIFVSGKSVTGVGLTASAEKDELGDGGWTLKAGALVIASGGIACVDEFDKIDDTERAAMHEVMESQTVSVAKAGIVAQFKAKTSILAAANPKFGRFDPNKLPGLQFDIPPTILSRFDLIFPIIDVLDEAKDSALATHLLRVHRDSAEGVETPADSKHPRIEPHLLRQYVAYARQRIKPVLSDEAITRIRNFYVELRKMGKAEGSVPITPRQIEGLVRLSESSAKIRLSNTVEITDADRAIRLITYVLDKVSRDRETGKLDIDIIATGKPKSQMDKIQSILTLAQKIQTQLGIIEINRLIAQAVDEHVADEQTVRRMVDDLVYKGEFYKIKPGFVKIVNQVG
ncbi:MAG: minichromosome maintenance protein MCM [Candidatus Micrarchaeota archaeon]|nr:minichromosome maintenance protein MCM [Candidatus Micrarchaeota archaeon]